MKGFKKDIAEEEGGEGEEPNKKPAAKCATSKTTENPLKVRREQPVKERDSYSSSGSARREACENATP